MFKDQAKDQITYSPNRLQNAAQFYHTIFQHAGPQEHVWTGTQYYSIEFQSLLNGKHRADPLYYCLSTVDGTPAKANTSLSRKDDNLVAMYAIILDDIGTKVDHKIIPKEAVPTFIVETSHNNYQYVYHLATPITSIPLAKRVHASLRNHTPAIGDTGAFTAGRIARLPLGVNGKKTQEKESFQVRLKAANDEFDGLVEPGPSYEWQELLALLNVTLINSTSHDNDGSSQYKQYGQDTDTIDLLRSMQQAGHISPETDISEAYVSSLTESQCINVECPREHEHTDRDPSHRYDAGYSPAGRWFKCHHAHDGLPPDTEEFFKAYGIQEEFDITKGGEVKPTMHNAIIAIKKLGVNFRLNTLADDQECYDESVPLPASTDDDSRYVPIHNSIIGDMRIRASKAFNNVDFSAKTMVDAVEHLTYKYEYNPAQDFFNDLPAWDGQHRAESIFIEHQGADDTIVHRMMTRKWLLAVVARTMNPGCKFDHAIFLTGNEGTGKSSMFTALAIRPEWFAELTTVDTKNREENTRGSIIVELSEGIVINRHTNEEVKHMISSSQSKFRPAYGHVSNTYLTAHVYCGSSNTNEFLSGDQQGIRRIWPIRTNRPANNVYDYKQFIKDIPQIYAEVMVWRAAGETLSLPKSIEDEAFSVREQAINSDPWEEDIVAFLDAHDIDYKMSGYDGEIITAVGHSILYDILNIDTDRRTPSNKNRIKSIMNSLKNWKHMGRVNLVANIGKARQIKGWKRLHSNLDSYGNKIVK